MTLNGAWENASVVAVGEITGIREIGIQLVSRLPSPVQPSVHELYWCEAEFASSGLIKGTISSPDRKLIWASIHPGCPTTYGSSWTGKGPFFEVWFLREEGDYLRPVVDGGVEFEIFFKGHWNGVSGPPARKEFGRLLLTPSANSENPTDYAHGAFELMSLARDVLGDQECFERLQSLALAQNSDVRKVACDFIESQLGRKCFPDSKQ